MKKTRLRAMERRLKINSPYGTGKKIPSFFDIPAEGARFRPSKVGLRDAEAAFQNFETPPLFCHV
jgi:hypothetical protein